MSIHIYFIIPIYLLDTLLAIQMLLLPKAKLYIISVSLFVIFSSLSQTVSCRDLSHLPQRYLIFQST